MRRPIIFVLLAGFAALVASLVVYSALKKREAEVQQAKVQSVDIVVAAHALGVGTKLDQSSVRTARWSRDSLPPGSFTDASAVMNKYTKASFVENQPIVADWLFSGEKNAGVLPLLIPTGMRALSVPVDEVSDIAGFVLPHARVDVLVSVTNGEKPLSKIVLQDVEVLAIAQDIEQINDKPQLVHVVTMLVTPDQAERLTLASGQGGLRLALRNYDDQNVVATNGVTVAQLMNEQPDAAPITVQQHVVFAAPHSLPRPVNIEVMRNGTTTESVTFVRSGSGRGASVQTAPSEPLPQEGATPSAAGDSSAADTPGNFASAAGAGPFVAPATESFPERRHTAPDSTTRRIGAAGSAPALPGAAYPAPPDAPPSDAAAEESSGNGPQAKTIDVP
jgi:pilus assembly protein CpaB